MNPETEIPKEEQPQEKQLGFRKHFIRLDDPRFKKDKDGEPMFCYALLEGPFNIPHIVLKRKQRPWMCCTCCMFKPECVHIAHIKAKEMAFAADDCVYYNLDLEDIAYTLKTLARAFFNTVELRGVMQMQTLRQRVILGQELTEQGLTEVAKKGAVNFQEWIENEDTYTDYVSKYFHYVPPTQQQIYADVSCLVAISWDQKERWIDEYKNMSEHFNLMQSFYRQIFVDAKTPCEAFQKMYAEFNRRYDEEVNPGNPNKRSRDQMVSETSVPVEEVNPEVTVPDETVMSTEVEGQ